MKVLMINGSPNEKGCTYTALNVIADMLKEEGIDSEIVQVTEADVTAEFTKEMLAKMEEADGLVVGSPVYFASPTGALISLMDRMFLSVNQFHLKPAASITSARRAGTSATLDVMNKYLTFAGMSVVGSNYYNCVHGHTPEEVLNDAEGIQTMRILGRNMAYLIKCIDAGKKAGIVAPVNEAKVKTSIADAFTK